MEVKLIKNARACWVGLQNADCFGGKSENHPCP